MSLFVSMVLDGRDWIPIALALGIKEELALRRLCSVGDNLAFACFCADTIAELKTPDSLKPSIMAYEEVRTVRYFREMKTIKSIATEN